MWHSPDIGAGSRLETATAVVLNPPSARHATRNSAEICRFFAMRRPQERSRRTAQYFRMPDSEFNSFGPTG
jgi:hypothetical protein